MVIKIDEHENKKQRHKPKRHTSITNKQKRDKKVGADLFHESQTRQRQDHETAIHNGGLKTEPNKEASLKANFN